MVANLNGGDWPELAVSIDLPPPKDHYDEGELAQNYATLAVHHGILWPRVVAALEYLRGHLIGAKGEAASARAVAEGVKSSLDAHTREVKLMREALQGQLAATALGLPPMRPEAPSTVSVVDSITSKVSGEFEKIARESSGPYVEAEPKRLIDAVERAVAEELAKREAARKVSEDAARLAAFERVAAERRKLLRKVVGGFLLAAASAAGSWAWGKAQGHLEGRQAAMQEARQAIVAAASAPVSTAPATSATVLFVPAAPAAGKTK
jgi:flagellar biosynthesis/type III secretory pathway protein FliH